jgi:hypothetical protein
VWTIAEAALNEKDPLRMGVLMLFWLESNIMASIPFFTVNRLGISMTRQVRTSLTKPGWVAIGEAYGKSTAHLEQVEETVFKLGRDIDIPKGLENLDGQFEDPRVLMTETELKTLTYEFNEAAINGPFIGANPPGAPLANAPAGIRTRINDVAGEVGLGDALLAPGGAATPFGPNASSLNHHSVLDAMNRSMYFLDGKRPDSAYCNKTFLLALESAFRREQLFSITRDQYERIVYTFRDCPIYDVGTKADQSTPIITDTEAFGGQTDCTSIYFAHVGVRTHFHGWEKEPLDVRDLGELQTEPVMRTRVDWSPGLASWHVRSLARVQGIRALV